MSKFFFETLIVKCEYFRIKVSLKDEVIAENFYFYGGYGFDELDAAFQYLDKRQLLHKSGFLDIGANIGFMSLYALSKYNFKSAFCIEPDELNNTILKDN